MPLGSVIDDKRFMSSVLDTMGDGLMVVDRNGNILSLNRAAEEITGYRKEELIGKNCSILDTDTCMYHDAEGKKVKCSLFDDGEVVRRSCRIRAKNGSWIYLLKNATVLRNEEGDIVAGVETMTDVTSLVMKDRQLEELKLNLKEGYSFMGIIGTSPSMKRVFEQMENASRSEAPVIVVGESGTGKELVAHAIHELSKRKSGPFIKVNCAALNEHILESELFGHSKGAFTGAMRDREGRFEVASGGTIFLDEIGDIPLPIQVKLLRVLEEKEIERVGENRSIPVDIRLLTATNKDLHSLVASGDFREDLLYRVNVIPLEIPPLRRRKEDIPLLITHFLKKISMVNDKEITTVSPQAMEIMKQYKWPGNVRQLVNTLEYSAITCSGDTIDVADLPDYIFRSKPHALMPRTKVVSEESIASALKRFDGSRTHAAQHLGISRVTLWKKMKEFGLK